MLLKIGKNKFSNVLKGVFLYFSIIALSILSNISVHFFSKITIFPNLANIFIFYFLIIKKEKVSYFSIFILGLFFDSFSFLPLGLSSFSLLIATRFLVFSRVNLYTPDSFIVIIRDYSIFTIVFIFFQWCVISILNKTYFPLSISFLQFFINIIFFILFYKLIRNIERFYI